ncbi:MAG: HTTM domain-containing protein [Isosphaeraceae bacterium]|nr:HTTM domain-containing protein [Isosphaeraceae bacterium]
MAMNPVHAWNRFWFAPVSARPLATFRIVIGCLGLINLAFLTIDVDHWLSGEGLLRGAEARYLAGPLRHSILQWIQTPAFVHGFLAVHAAVLLLLTLGKWTRVVSILAYLGQLMIHQRNIATASGADVLLMVMLFYLMLSPCGAAYSLDALRERRRRGTEADPIIVPWAQRLIQIQVTIMYFVTSVLKCAGTTWLTGTAVHYVVCNQELGRFDLGGLAAYPAFINIVTYGGLGVEFALAFLLWVKPARPYVIAAGIALHVGIWALVNIPLFGELSMAGYLVFLDSDDFEALRRFFDFRARFRGKSRAKLGKAYRVDPPASPIAGMHHTPASDLAPSTSSAWEWTDGTDDEGF